MNHINHCTRRNTNDKSLKIYLHIVILYKARTEIIIIVIIIPIVIISTTSAEAEWTTVFRMRFTNLICIIYIDVVELLSLARDYNIPRSWSCRTIGQYIYIIHASPVSLSLINIFIRRKMPYRNPSPPLLPPLVQSVRRGY